MNRNRIAKTAVSQPCGRVLAFVASALFLNQPLRGGEIVLDDFESAETFTSADVTYAQISGWGSENGKDDVFDHEISGGQLRRVDIDQHSTRVGAVFRVDLSAVTGPMTLELDLLSGDINDMNFYLGVDDGDNGAELVVFDMDSNGPDKLGAVPNDEAGIWLQVFTDGWAYDVPTNPRYSHDIATGRVTADLSTDLAGNEVGDVSGYDLVAIYINSDVDAGIVIDNIKLTFSGPAVPPPPLQITDFEYDHGANMATISWASQEGKYYSIDESTGLLDSESLSAAAWTENRDGVPGDEVETTITVEVLPEHRGLDRLFFRVREE